MVTIEDRVAALMAEANPVPDYEQIELVTKGTAYLATLEQRSSKVAQLDTRQTEPETQWKPTWSLAAAVAAVFLGVAALAFLSQGNDDVPPATTPSSTTVPVDLNSFEGIWTTGGLEFQFAGGFYVISEDGSRSDSGQVWLFGDGLVTLVSGAESEDCPSGATGAYEFDFVDDETLELSVSREDCATRPGLGSGSITLTFGGNTSTGDPEWDAITAFVSPEGPSGVAPGEYRTGRFAVPFRFNVEAGWTSFLQERSDALTFASLNPESNVEVHLFEPATVLETLDFFDRPELNMSQGAVVTLDGADGFYVTLSPTENEILFNDLLDGAYTVNANQQTVLWVVDVGGRPVTIVHQAAGDDGLTKGTELIGSIVWKDN